MKTGTLQWKQGFPVIKQVFPCGNWFTGSSLRAIQGLGLQCDSTTFFYIFYQDKKYSLQKMSLNVWSLQFSKQVPNGTFWPIWKMIPLLGYLEKVFHPWLILWKKWQFFFFFYREAREKKRFRNKSDKSSCVSYQQWQTSLVYCN